MRKRKLDDLEMFFFPKIWEIDEFDTLIHVI